MAPLPICSPYCPHEVRTLSCFAGRRSARARKERVERESGAEMNSEKVARLSAGKEARNSSPPESKEGPASLLLQVASVELVPV
eukprot:6196257-Pleurochrysis_carterae.AAC.1